MALDPALVGRSYPPSAVYEVGRPVAPAGMPARGCCNMRTDPGVRGPSV